MNTTSQLDTKSRTDNNWIADMLDIPSANDILNELPATEEILYTVETNRFIIKEILNGNDDRLLVITWPCSIHNPEAAIKFAEALVSLKEENPHLHIVMRVYFEKPRSRKGWKGLINDPDLDGSFNIEKWLRVWRELLLKINEMGIGTAVEFLDSISPQYIADLVSWGAIGARNTEAQWHRELASGLSMPVWFKNGTSWNTDIAIDAIKAANQPHHFLWANKDWESSVIVSRWNPDWHIVLRWWWEKWTNYDAQSVSEVVKTLDDEKINTWIVIDFSHANSKKSQENQPRVCLDVSKQIACWNKKIVWVMIEANIKSWNQKLIVGQIPDPGISITDECVDLERNAEMLSQLNDAVEERLSA